MKSVKSDCKTAAERVQTRFEQWRKTRSKQGPIPTPLLMKTSRATLILLSFAGSSVKITAIQIVSIISFGVTPMFSAAPI